MERNPKRDGFVGRKRKRLKKEQSVLQGTAVVEQSRLNRQAQKMEKNQQFRCSGTAGFLLFWEGTCDAGQKGRRDVRGKRYGYIRVSSTDQNEDRQKLLWRRWRYRKRMLFIWDKDSTSGW